MTQNLIAAKLGVHKSSISREIVRNADGRSREYKANLAHRKSILRKKDKPKVLRFTQSMKDLAKTMIETLQYSPEQIAGKCKQDITPMVSQERLYQWIWEDKKAGGGLYLHLRRKGRKYRKRGNSKDTRGIISGRVDISQRPSIVDDKVRVGDLEIDTIIGENHKGTLLTINDRVTGIVWIRKLLGKDSQALTGTAIEALLPFKGLIKTITADNGKEFAKHESIGEALDIQFFFAKPYHSWERGANENTNGLIRQYFPKGSSFEMVTNEDVQKVQDKLNDRPRKRLGFLSPNEKYSAMQTAHG